ncbi:hypothetical protein SK854_14105 [Lentzea sp. BCCO 10_0061]|uniref:Uncharacterized protein n=1 Tax=Lentzea sokolovensis TaxID=3095429 RepID=A0ABU4UUS5_9PSEU|nr:hypothetical protein [Lentzea sp. BCCO 10_0061]MDX8143257.1 hypothetical protein [Lentzea sp. BCCO 10_0061]
MWITLNQEHTIDPDGLVGVLDRPRFERWTGVEFGPMQSLEWLYLWLACVLENSLCSISVEQVAIDAGLVVPMFRASTMGVPGKRELAYLTQRPAAGHTKNTGKIMEVGVIGHSDAGADLCDHVAQEVRTWSEQQRGRIVHFEIPATGPSGHTPDGCHFLLDRPHNPLVVTWR